MHAGGSLASLLIDGRADVDRAFALREQALQVPASPTNQRRSALSRRWRVHKPAVLQR